MCWRELPNLVFIMETKLESRRVERVRKKCGFTEGVEVSSSGRAGGLALWWRDIMTNMVSFSQNHITVDVVGTDNNPVWRAIGWSFFGDFNEILTDDEKVGGVPRAERCMDGFCEAMDSMGVRDLGFKGCKFTWKRGLSVSNLVRERLDRGLASEGWCTLFPGASVINSPIDVKLSDHGPIVIKVDGSADGGRNKKLFRFEKHWLSRTECEGVVKDYWSSAYNDPIQTKIAGCAVALSSWAGKTFGDIKKRKRKAEEELKEIQKGAMDDVGLSRCKRLSEKLAELRLMEESYWYSRARAWTLDGEEALKGLSCMITEEMNQTLCAAPTSAKISKALFEMHPNKAPGIDGEGLIHGVVCHGAPNISHLFFADDSIFFSRANINECSKIANILTIFESASGQKINLSKSEVSFSKNVRPDKRKDICELLGVGEVEKHEKYLGIPTIIGKSKNIIFASLKSRIWKKLQGWKEKLMSKAGKEILLKSVVLAIQTYLMGVFKLPGGLLDDIHSVMARFWWGNGGDGKMHWKSWEYLCRPKSRGGMGFRDLRVFNQALLAKQGWRLIHDRDTLLYKVLKAKYFKSSDFIEARRGFDPSYTWRSIWGAKSLLLEGLIWRVDNGLDIKVWSDKWLPRETGNEIPIPPANGLHDPDLRVSDIIDHQTGQWDVREMGLHLAATDIADIMNIPLLPSPSPDIPVWKFTKNRVFSVKSAYWFGMDSPSSAENLHNEDYWKPLWCNVDEESVVHAIFQCPTSCKVWEESPFRDHVEAIDEDDFCSLLSHWLRNFSREQFSRFATIMWAMWLCRNKMIFEDSTQNPHDVAIGLLKFVAEHNSYTAKDPSIAEAAAVLYGVQLAIQNGYTKVWVESDAANIIQKLNVHVQELSYLYLFIERILLLVPNFSYFKCSHVRRNGNTVAHLLARSCTRDVPEQCYFESFPEGVLRLAELDIN
ncbi:uncharacterized protein LOC110706169 [Chenopodium quinoa]|uniref:uncharacterized protein LOC110706169 n=1 Tax=Chenopodium quinoa TaxID=63459 RepID=UPI000B774BB0|nr:uncharacterized protein LOC110706169 [Chenopodium quinoa]